MEIAVAKILRKFGQFLFSKVYLKMENQKLRIKILKLASHCISVSKEIYSKDRRKSK